MQFLVEGVPLKITEFKSILTMPILNQVFPCILKIK